MAATRHPVPVQCSAAGTKLFAPPAELCRRFLAALGAAADLPVTAAESVGDGWRIELGFAANGVASASVARMKGGRVAQTVRHDLAISDRAFNAADIDRLAGDVARSLRDAT